MCPKYSNLFSVSKNGANGEAVLIFKHSYPVFDPAPEGTANTKPKTETEDVASIVMSPCDIEALRQTLNKVFGPDNA